jgi:hypothetical protein
VRPGLERGTELGAYLETLAREIEADHEALLALMERHEIGTDRLKVATGWAAEKAGRLKLNGRLTRYSPISRLVEVEGLLLAVQGKLAAWRALRELVPNEPRLDPEELDRLAARAERQLDHLRAQHHTLAATALIERGEARAARSPPGALPDRASAIPAVAQATTTLPKAETGAERLMSRDSEAAGLST